MRVLVAPQEFKGSLTARAAADAIAGGVRAVMPDADVVTLPMSDGGPGMVDAMLAACGGERVPASVHDPLMRPITTHWARLPHGTAVIEMAAASGLVLLSDDERDPLIATTYGTGELIRAALDAACTQIIVGVGGSATVDAGAGAMQALGARLLDKAGDPIPFGGAPLTTLERIDLTSRDPRLGDVRLRIASDVTNVLCGPVGAARIFGPQKGASAQDVDLLDAALTHFADVARRDCGVDLRSLSGGGAAGGLGAGLVTLMEATVEPGFALVAEAVGLASRIADADAVITGEGRLDAQTAYGKTAAGVARMARVQGKLVAVVAGRVADDFRDDESLYDVAEPAAGPSISDATAMLEAPALVRGAAARAMRGLAQQAAF